MSPNSFNEYIYECQRKALEQGLKALDEDEKLLLFTRPYVRRGTGPEKPIEKPKMECPVFRKCIGLGGDENPEQEPGTKNDESFRWPSKAR